MKMYIVSRSELAHVETLGYYSGLFSGGVMGFLAVGALLLGGETKEGYLALGLSLLCFIGKIRMSLQSAKEMKELIKETRQCTHTSQPGSVTYHAPKNPSVS